MNTTNKTQELREIDLEELIEYEFFHSEPTPKGIRDNTTKSISKKLGIPFYTVDRIINKLINKKSLSEKNGRRS